MHLTNAANPLKITDLVGAALEALQHQQRRKFPQHKEMNPPSASVRFEHSDNRGVQVGYSTGTIETHHHHHSAGKSSDTRETAPNSTILIPFARDVDFVERGTILDQVHRVCSVPGSRTALVGFGGVGKSQLAIEYAYRSRDRSPDTWLFWIHASNAERFKQSYQDVANLVKIPGRQDPQTNILQLVHDWLRDERNGPWVLVLDNVDDASFLEARNVDSSRQARSMEMRPLKSYLPQCQHGCILVTSRTMQAARTLVEDRNVIAVGPMSEDAALALLQRKLGRQDDDAVALELVKLLEFMPLAIVQAAAYITQLAPRYSARQYVEQFQISDKQKSSLLNHEGGRLRRDDSAKNSIIVSWQISFEHIRERRESAAELLSLMSFFDSRGIPEALLRRQIPSRIQTLGKHSIRASGASGPRRFSCPRPELARTAEEDQDAGEDYAQMVRDEFERDVLVLRDFSLISLGADPTVFEMHKLIQLATRTWLERSNSFDKWQRQAIENLDAEFPEGHYENWARCAAYLPHVQSACVQQPKEKSSILHWASLQYKRAWYAQERGDMSSALDMATKSWKARERMLGPEDEATIESKGIVGTIYSTAGRWKEAEKLQRQVMEIHERLLGQQHPETLANINNLALILTNQGRLNEAEKLQVQVMETCKRLLGQDHPGTLTSMINLAVTFRDQERLNEAQELQSQVRETHRRIFGQDHPSTLSSGVFLATTFLCQGRWNEAEELQIPVLESMKRVLGQEHPDTLSSMTNLAVIFYNQGRLNEAKELGVQVTEIWKRVCGQEHPGTLYSMHSLARISMSLGKCEEAIKLMKECVDKRDRVLGPDHPSTKHSQDILEGWLAHDSTYN